MAGAAALAMAASIPVAAQVSPAAPPGMPWNPSPIGDTSAIAKEAPKLAGGPHQDQHDESAGKRAARSDVHCGNPGEGGNQGGNSGFNAGAQRAGGATEKHGDG